MTFAYSFYKHIMFRHSCGKCPYTNLRRPSDITLADFWGWEESVPEMNKDNKGVSLVICNTKKGQEIFNQIRDRMTVEAVELDNCIQPNMVCPTDIHPDRMAFEEYYIHHGFLPTMRRYGDFGWRYKIRSLFWFIYCRLRELKNKMLAKIQR